MPEKRETSMGRVRHIHFVGIGGAGMCGIAEILHNLGYKISGSDLKNTAVTEYLEKLGVRISLGHSAGQVSGSDVVVVSSAVSAGNPEVEAARQMRIPVIRRAEMLAEIMRFKQGIAVAGTHGKTTTTSLTAGILAEEGLDPTFVIGGQLNSIGANARLGSGRYLVAEADESDASFLHLQPVMAVLTNIDADHLGAYGSDFGRLMDAFLEFLQRLPFYGLAVLCLDDQGVRDILPEVSKPYMTYGVDREADITASDIHFDRTHTSFTVARKDNPEWLRVKLNLPGKHNVLNALGAISVAAELGVSDSSIISALQDFQGIVRRCDVMGEISLGEGKVTLIDDYAHHPSEIRATLSAVRSGWPGARIVVVFQPHRYSRTRDLFEEFCAVLSEIEALVLMHVYPAGEKPIPGVGSRGLCDAIASGSGTQPLLAGDRDELLELLPGAVKDKDILLIMGAGDVGSLAAELYSKNKIPAR